ncbi:MAG: hypothetical protein WBF77_05970 [Sulfurimonadaceae bacterium]
MKYVIAFSILLGLSISPLYAKKDKSQLPKGLQKKAASGKQLPPGWEKKLKRGNTLDGDIYRQGKVVVPLDPLGLVTIRVDDRLIRLHKETRKIIDILR